MKLRTTLIAVLIIVAAVPPSLAVGDGSTVIPLYVERRPSGDPELGIDISFGSRRVRVLFGTGLAGLRLLASMVPPSAAQRTGAGAMGGNNGLLTLYGDEAMARVSIADSNVAETTAIGLIDYACGADQPNCAEGDGVKAIMFGGLFPGIFGVGVVDPPRGTCCSNPLEALGDFGKHYIVHANFKAPTLTLNPTPAVLSKFTMINVPRGLLPQGCVRVVGAQGAVCGDISFATGSPQITLTTKGIPTQGPFSSATLAIGTWSHTFTSTPEAPLRIFARRGTENSVVIGLAAMQSVDVYYDLSAGRMGFASTE
jgi:hypothetical protein